MRRISFVLLLLEAAVLLYPSFLGLLLVVSALIPLATGSVSWPHVGDAAAAAMVLAGLCVGWTLLATRILRGIEAARALPRALWIVAAILAVLACVSFVVRFSDSPMQLLALGICFVPTFGHLLLDVWLGRATGTYNTTQSAAR